MALQLFTSLPSLKSHRFKQGCDPVSVVLFSQPQFTVPFSGRHCHLYSNLGFWVLYLTMFNIQLVYIMKSMLLEKTVTQEMGSQICQNAPSTMMDVPTSRIGFWCFYITSESDRT